VISTGGGCVTTFDGTGGAGLGVQQGWKTPIIGNEHPGISLGEVVDLDGDGDRDLVTAGLCVSAPQSLVVFRNDGQGDLADRFSATASTFGYGWSVATGDLDLDGDIDVVVTTALPGRVIVLRQGPIGTFTVVQEFDPGVFIRHARIADLDGDCKPEIVAVDLAANQLFVFRNITPEVEGCGGLAGQSDGAKGSSARRVPVPAAPVAARGLAAAAGLAARIDAARPDGASAVTRVLADFGSSASEDPIAVEARTRPEGSIETAFASSYSSCGPPSAPCYLPHEAPGCFSVECCKTVCKFEPACCTETWDTYCVFVAQQSCSNLSCPNPGSCFEVHFNRGCEDEVCCRRIARIDPFCGSNFWDEICVIEAQRFCGVEACSLPSPEPASIDELELCYQRLNQGCTALNETAEHWIELACDMKVHGQSVTGAPRDADWFIFEVTSSTTVRLEVSSEFPARLLLLDGPCEGPLRLLGEASGANCQAFSLERELAPGIYQFMLAPGTAERNILSGQPCADIDPDNPPNPKLPPIVPGFFGVHWQATFTCGNGAITGDVNGDGFVNGADLALVLGQWGACSGCAADLNGDGVVGGLDLAIVLGNWTG